MADIVKAHHAGQTVVPAVRPVSDPDKQAPKPFGFYDAAIINSFRFETDGIAPPAFYPDEEYAFMFAPLDTIRAADAPPKDPRGLDAPPAFRTQERIDLYALMYKGYLVMKTMPEGHYVENVYYTENGEQRQAAALTVDITMPLTPGRIPLLAQTGDPAPGRGRGPRHPKPKNPTWNWRPCSTKPISSWN